MVAKLALHGSNWKPLTNFHVRNLYTIKGLNLNSTLFFLGLLTMNWLCLGLKFQFGCTVLGSCSTSSVAGCMHQVLPRSWVKIFAFSFASFFSIDPCFVEFINFTIASNHYVEFLTKCFNFHLLVNWMKVLTVLNDNEPRGLRIIFFYCL